METLQGVVAGTPDHNEFTGQGKELTSLLAQSKAGSVIINDVIELPHF
jgi:hypothetical protein